MKRVGSPQDIIEHLKRYIVGQDAVLTDLAVSTYLHMQQIDYRYFSKQYPRESRMHLKKPHILLMGPTGCGKSYMAQNVAEYLELPFVKIDMNYVTPMGWSGTNFDDYFTPVYSKLLNADDRTPDEAAVLMQNCIVFLDEIDKVCMPEMHGSSDWNLKHQHMLLQALENMEIQVSSYYNVETYDKGKLVRTDSKLASEKLQTRNMLFILAGNFEEVRKNRAKFNIPNMGFKHTHTKGDSSMTVQQELCKFGVIPELMGRIPVVSELKELTEDDLYNILMKAEGSILKQYITLFNFLNAPLELSKHKLKGVLENCIKRKTGARGLDTEIFGLIKHKVLEL